MGSTNKTTHLKLPQWIGTDKPTFLGDMNDAFLKIDNGVFQADSIANTNQENIATIQEKVNKLDTDNAQHSNDISELEKDVNNLEVTDSTIQSALAELKKGITTWDNVYVNCNTDLNLTFYGGIYCNDTLKFISMFGVLQHVEGTLDGSQWLIKTRIKPKETRTVYGILNMEYHATEPVGGINYLFQSGITAEWTTEGIIKIVGSNQYNNLTAINFNVLLNATNWEYTIS